MIGGFGMANKLVFRKLVEARELVEAVLRNKEFYGEDDSLEKKQLLALKVIFDYIKDDETWTGQKRSRRKAIIFIKNRCNYVKTKEELGAKSKNSVEASMSYLSKKLEAKIGANTIDLIMQGKIEEAMTQFQTGTGRFNLSDYIVEGLLDLLPKTRGTNVTLEDCKKELRFLLTFSKFNLERLIALHNEGNFSYIQHILTSTDISVADERKVLYQLLSGEFSKSDDGSSLDINSQIKMAFEQQLADSFR